MQKIIPVFLFLLFSLLNPAAAQPQQDVYFKGAIKESKEILQKNLLRNTINKNLSLPLNEETEENWMDAFWGMQLLHYSSPWADGRINLAIDSIGKRSIYFQRALLELAYTNYQDRYLKEITSFMSITRDAKIFAMCAEYLALNKITQLTVNKLKIKRPHLVKNDKDKAIINELLNRLTNINKPVKCATVNVVTSQDFLKGIGILYSFQRKNRNYPGIAMVRDSTGRFIRDETGNVFSVPQLARSISNMPGYLTNGNTPQGIFRMYGFDTSKTTFIGPTTNIQLTMPFETSLQHFLNDSTITDTAWSEQWYASLLPEGLKNCQPLFESFYAGKAGRSEIIAHGTTVDPEYYKGKSYYPQTPTMGCLCTKEIWNDVDGKRMESDQQKLVAALMKAGGANGYCVVIEIDDQQRAVTIQDLLSLINKQDLL